METVVVETLALSLTALALGTGHTLVGLDHAIPFVAMGKSRDWSLGRTLHITFWCGLGHVLGLVLIGLGVILLGWGLDDAIAFEVNRGDWAGYGLVTLGIATILHGMRRCRSAHTHTHEHTHSNGLSHSHAHSHGEDHSHAHPQVSWPAFSLFVIFLLGPCEVLIPVLMVPAAAFGALPAAVVTLSLAVATIATMMLMVWALMRGVDILPSKWITIHSQWLTGGSIVATGGAVLLAGA